MIDFNAGLSQSSDASVTKPMAQDTTSSASAFQDQFHDHLQVKFGTGTGTGAGGAGTKESVLLAQASPEPASQAVAGSGAGTKESVLLAQASPEPASQTVADSGAGSILNYAGYLTYAGLAASAFGHDDPLQLQTRATRFFQEKILHHHAIDNPQVWAAMGDALMIEQHLASQGANFKPVKLRTLNGEVKRESAEEKRQTKDLEHDGKEADGIIKDITSGLRSKADYVLAAKFLYTEAVRKADERGVKEGADHKDEKRLLGRLTLLSGETDRTDAFGTRDNSVDPVLDELGSRVSYRLDEAALLDRYGSKVPELGWTKEAADLRAQAKAIYDDPTALSEPVRMRLHQKYADILTNTGKTKDSVTPGSGTTPA